MFENIEIILTLTILIAVFVSFILEKIPAHVTAMIAMCLLLALGLITTKDALSVFSNSAPVTIACMFIMSAALERTGVIDLMGVYVLKLAKRNKALAILVLLGGAMLFSAFMNNTPVVVIMTPVVIAVANGLKKYPSKFLIPLSYAAIFGGTCTLIGTSTNILVDGIARTYDQPPFGMFEISIVGICMAFVGTIYMLVIGSKLLPKRKLLIEEIVDEDERKKFISEAIITPKSLLIGKTINQIEINKDSDYEIIDLIRNDSGTRSASQSVLNLIKGFLDKSNSTNASSTYRDIAIKAGDRLVIRSDKEELIKIKDNLGLQFNNEEETSESGFAQITTSRETITIEGVIGYRSDFIGKTPAELRLRRRYGCYILAIHKGEQNISHNFDQVALKQGDIMLFEGTQEDLERLFANENILSLSQVKRQSFNTKKAPIALATLAAVVGLAATHIMPIAGLAIIGAVICVTSGCVSTKRAFDAIEWPILLLIFGMISLAIAMDRTGTAVLIANYISTFAADYSPLLVLVIVYGITSFFTETMSNNAVAVLLTPIAITLANSLGVDPRPFIIAVMMAASASFATPIGYQTNTYVYNAGNYKFKDFIKVGLPLNIITMLVAVSVIPIFWEF